MTSTNGFVFKPGEMPPNGGPVTDEQIERFKALLDGMAAKGEENLTPEEKQKREEAAADYLKRDYLERFNILNVDLHAEFELIKKKESKLSRSRRDAVVGYMLIFEIGPQFQRRLEELKNKPNKTPEEEALLKEMSTTNVAQSAMDILNAADELSEAEMQGVDTDNLKEDNE